MSPRSQLVCAWLGLVLIVGFFIGFIPLAGFVPPTEPSASAQSIAAEFSENRNNIRIGCFVMIISLTLFVPWGGMIAARTWKMERNFPLFTILQVACVAGATLIAIFVPVCWALAAYRSDADPDVTRMLNDAAWFMFLYTWPLFSAWCIAIAVPILRAAEGTATLPRWIAYLSLWVAVLIIPTGFIAFTHDGPMAYDGVIAFYIPTAVFFVWMLAMTYAAITSIKADVQERPARPEPERADETFAEVAA